MDPLMDSLCKVEFSTLANQRKSTIKGIFLHSKQQKPYQGTLRTQEPTPMGSETMDPTGPLKYMVPEGRFLSATNPDKKICLAQINFFVWQLSIIDIAFSQTIFFVLAGLN